MKAGGNRYLITFWEKLAPVQDDGGGLMTGGEAIYWTTNARVSKVTSLGSRRDVEGFETDLIELMQINLRYRSDKTVTKNMQIEYEGQRFTIQNIEDISELHRELLIIAKSRE